MAIRPCQELAEGRQGPRRYDIRLGRGRGFDPADDNPGLGGQAHLSRRLTQIGRFAGIGFDQSHAQVGAQGRQDEPGKPGTTAQIDHCCGLWRDQGNELGRIENMPVPNVLERRRPDEIYGPLPFLEGSHHGIQPTECFT